MSDFQKLPVPSVSLPAIAFNTEKGISYIARISLGSLICFEDKELSKNLDSYTLPQEVKAIDDSAIFIDVSSEFFNAHKSFNSLPLTVIVDSGLASFTGLRVGKNIHGEYPRINEEQQDSMGILHIENPKFCIIQGVMRYMVLKNILLSSENKESESMSKMEMPIVLKQLNQV